MVGAVSGTLSNAADGGTLQSGAATRWGISAGALNALWGDVFPRLVAKHWLGEIHLDPGEEMAPDKLRGLVGGLMKHPLPAAQTALDHVPIDGLPRIGSVGDTEDKLRLVHEAFAEPSPPPLAVLAEGGHDFLLSEDGIELCYPKKPTNVRSLLRFYSYRKTGQPSIGLPYYLPGPCSGMSTDAPTGPSQAMVPVSQLSSYIDRFAGCLRDEVYNLVKGDSRDSPTHITLQQYACMMSHVRNWQIQGSVFRGIMVELPRVVATAWMEALDGRHNVEDAYWHRLFGPEDDTNQEGGLRDIFRQRLETSIPSPSKMDFRIRTAPVVGVSRWKPDDVMVTEDGFHFPRPREMSGDDSQRMDIFRQIAEGRAGNPVFTDSKRTQGGGGE